MSRTSVVIAGTLLGLGVLLPVESLARLLAGASSPLLPQVVTGMWCVKAMLVLHAALVLVLPRLSIAHVRGPAPAPSAVRVGGRVVPYQWAILAALVLVGLLLRLYRLPNGLWFDEIQTLVEYVRLPLGQVLTTYDSQNQHLLYSVLARISFMIFGESAWALRLPAAMFGIGSLLAFYYMARLVVSRVEALLAVALLTFSYHHVWFSQNARGYTGLLFFTLIATACFLKMVAGRYRHPWWIAVAYAAAMALAAYTHITAVLIGIAHGVIWLVLLLRVPTRPRGLDAWLPLFGLILAVTFTLQLYAPVLPQVYGTVMHPPRGAAPTAWQSPLWFLTESARGLARGVPGGWITLGAGLLVVSCGMASFARRSFTVLATMLLPALVSGAALLALEHNLWPRFFFFSAGFAVLIVIRGGFALVHRVLPPRLHLLAPLATALVILVSATTVPRAWYPKQDFSGAITWLEGSTAPGDAVATVDLTRFPYQEFYRTPYVPVDSLPALEELERTHDRTWVLYTFPIRLKVVQPAIWARLQEQYTLAARFPGTVGGGEIVVMKRKT